MLYTFKSRAASDLILLEADGRHLLTLIGKDPDAPHGVITTVQIPLAIAALNAAVAKDEAQAKAKKVNEQDDIEDDDRDAEVEAVALRRRVVPFIDWLSRSEVDGHDVMW